MSEALRSVELLPVAPALLYSERSPLGPTTNHRLEVLPMLPPYIIEEIRRRENEQRRRHEQPVLELPLPVVIPLPSQSPKRDDDDRGVVIIDL